MEKDKSPQEKLTGEEYEKRFFDLVDMAAHDLDSPLRKLSSFTERLSLKYKDETDEQTRSYIQRILACVSTMRSLIDDLTEFSKANAEKINYEEYGPLEIMTGIREELGDELREANSFLEVDNFSPLKGDRRQYRRLFYNLISNAIKFRKRDESLKLHISTEPLTEDEKKRFDLTGSYDKIVISDNGIGFDAEDAEKIFEPFVRLHGKSEFPGSGLGLSIAKKIVQNHKGFIYADSRRDHGSRFILILPKTA